jgi:hypothetical protein
MAPLHHITGECPGTYSITETNHCGTHDDAFRVDFLAPPVTFELGPDTTFVPVNLFFLPFLCPVSILNGKTEVPAIAWWLIKHKLFS